MQSLETSKFRPGFLSSLNRSFRLGRSQIKRDAPKIDFEQPEMTGEELGTFRRCHTISGRRQGLVKIPEMPLGSDLLKRVWNDGLDTMSGGKDAEGDISKPLCNEIATPRIDSYRFSMANLEDSQEVDLDAILTELCALETKCDEEIKRNSLPISLTNNKPQTQREITTNQMAVNSSTPMSHLQRTDSPDNDSAFSDTVSMLSSESSTSSGASAVNKFSGISGNSYHSKDALYLAKQEKIRLALEKMKKASIKKLFIKAFTIDGSSKSLLVDEKMTCGYVTRLLADKNHVAMDPKWAIVEYLNDLYMERIFEDHEMLVDNLMLWARDSKNKIYFVERPEKVALFQTPEKYLITDANKNFQSDYDEHSRSIMIEEFFSQSPPNDSSSGLHNCADNIGLIQHPTPSLEGPLYLKSDGKKGWKKYYCVLKPSAKFYTGIYYNPKEKSKTKELTCLASFGVNEIYVGINWKKKYKAPTDYCFALKHPRLQQSKGLKYIKFLCAEEKDTFDKWIIALRIAKHGKQLVDNYHTLADDLTQDDLDQLAYARSCSVISISHNPIISSRHNVIESPGNDVENKTIYSEGSIASSSDLSSARLSCASSSSSSGCMSDGGHSVCEGNAFDSDKNEFSTGTIKRKPSMKPNIPLTNMTRQLKEMADSSSCGSYNNGVCDLTSVTSTYTNTGTLTRRSNRRKSTQSNNTDDSSNSGTLKRYKIKTSQGSIDSASSSQSSNSGCTGSSNHRESPYGLANSPISNENQAPIYQKTLISKNGIQTNGEVEYETIPQTGIIMGYLTQHQTTISPKLEQLYSPENPNNGIYRNFDIDKTPNTKVSYTENLDAPRDQLQIELNDENIQNLPLPSPPNFINDGHGYEYNPMFSSTLSLESLPPPPPEAQPLNCCNLSESQLSLVSLPPPPPPIDLDVHFEHNIYKNRSSINNSNPEHRHNNTYESVSVHSPRLQNEIAGNKKIISDNRGLSPKTDYNSGNPQINTSLGSSKPSINRNISPQYVRNNMSEEIYNKTAEFERKSMQNSSPLVYHRSLPSSNLENNDNKKDNLDSKPVLRRKQVSFTETPSPKKNLNSISICESDTSSSSGKPTPPKRNENTKLTSPKKLSDSTSNPPKNFLIDLQKVMAKKWQVSQKCKLEPTTTPYEVLGFREYPVLQQDYKETNVSNWVQEHYGHINPPTNLYENIVGKSDKIREYNSSPYATTGSNHSASTVKQSENLIPVSKKRPPPPIPKRSENTQLSGSSMQKTH